MAGFVLDRLGKPVKLRFDGSEEIFALSKEPAPLGALSLRDDNGGYVLRINTSGRITLFGPGIPRLCGSDVRWGRKSRPTRPSFSPKCHNIRATLFDGGGSICRAEGPEELRSRGAEFVCGVCDDACLGNYRPTRRIAGIVRSVDLRRGRAPMPRYPQRLRCRAASSHAIRLSNPLSFRCWATSSL
jgi:Domain of unknown function (DUF4908)